MTPERLQQIHDLYTSARAQRPGQRGEFLAEACGGDRDLRRQVESLLAQHGGSPVDRRGEAMGGDTAKAKRAYQDFLDLWKDADKDAPFLTQATAELAKLR